MENYAENQIYMDPEHKVKIYEQLENIIFESDEIENKKYEEHFIICNGKRTVKGDKIRWTFEKINKRALTSLNSITSEKLENFFTKAKVGEKKKYIPYDEYKAQQAQQPQQAFEKTQIFPVEDDDKLLDISNYIRVIDYSPKCYVIFGVSRFGERFYDEKTTYRQKFESLSFLYNFKLDDEGEKRGGWLVAKSKKNDVEFLFNLIGKNSKNISSVKQDYNKQETVFNQQETVFNNQEQQNICNKQSILEKFNDIVNELETELLNVREKIIDDKLIILGNKNDVNKLIESNFEYEIHTTFENSKNKIVMLKQI